MVATDQAIQLRYMWADAGLPGFSSSLVKTNPLRWSHLLYPGIALSQLEAQARVKDRSVRLRAAAAEDQLLVEFETLSEAIQWIRSNFDCRVKSVARRAEQHFNLFQHCTMRQEEVHEAHEYVEVNDASTAMGNSLTAASSADSSAASSAVPTSDLQAIVSRHGREVAQDAVRLKYMWADAKVLPLQFMRELAQANPLRWSRWQTSTDLAAELESQAQVTKARPVILAIDMPQLQEVQLTFCSAAAAARWMHKTFDRPDATVVESNRAADQEQEDRLCVICLSAARDVMLMPCRHAVLCSACLESLMLREDAACPVCRKQIRNYAYGFFVDDYVERVQAIEARLELSGTAAYDGMYNHIRPLMVAGALLASGATACFVLALTAAPALAAGAFAVGYVPWFLTTVAQFEQEDMGAESLAPMQIFSREDWRHPLTLLAKTAVLSVAVPVSAAVFFLPYGLYAGVLRPAALATVKSLIRTFCFAYTYVARPAASRIAAVLKTLGNVLAASVSSMADVVVACSKALHDFLLIPGCNFIKGAFSLISQTVAELSRSAYDNVLAPCAKATWALIKATSLALNSYVIAPSISATSAALGMLYENVLLPSCRAGYVTLQVLGRVIVAAGRGMYSHILVPLCQILDSGMTSAATCLYTFILLPLGETAFATLHMLRRGVRTAANGLYTYCLVSCGKALEALGAAISFFARGLAGTAELLFHYVLMPSWKLAGRILHGLGQGMALAAETAYRAFVVPTFGVAGSVARVISGCFIVASATIYTYALVPSAALLSSGAKAVYVCAILPSARAAWNVGAATAGAVQCAATATLELGVAGAALVYVYVIQPGGHAVLVLATTAGACTQEVGLAARSTYASVSSAGREAMSALRQTRS